MFILRQVSERGESNQALGKSYTFTHQVYQPEEFNKLVLIHEDAKASPLNLTAYVHSEGGEVYRIYTDHSTFIMTESGKTFARLG